MRMNDKVIIGFLSPGEVDTMFALRLAAIFRERRDRVVDLMTDENSGLLSRGRNQVVANFLAHSTGAEWLLMLDVDQQLMLEDFDKLVAAAHDTDRPIVAGLYFGAWPGEFYPTAVPLIFYEHPQLPGRFVPFNEYPRDQIIPVDSAGTGCLLVHRSVFEKIAADADETHDIAHFADGSSAPAWCWFRDFPHRGDWFSEDHYFCARARERGFKLHAHTGVVLPHRKRFWLDERHHLVQFPEKLTAEERRSPRWAPMSGPPPEMGEPETAEAAPTVDERAVKPRPRRKVARR
jgi:hypothetical protein